MSISDLVNKNSVSKCFKFSISFYLRILLVVLFMELLFHYRCQARDDSNLCVNYTVAYLH